MRTSAGTMATMQDQVVSEGCDDTELAERIRCGDAAAENELVRCYHGRVLAMLVARLRDREAARELVDDVLMSTVMALRAGTVKDTSRLGAFMHGTAVNLANNYARSSGRRGRAELLDDEQADVEGAVGAARVDDLRALRQCVDRLPSLDRSILWLTLVEGLKPREIADRLDLSSAAVRQRKSRAVQTVREMLDPPSQNRPRGPLSSR